ncbi:hypothetical protein ISS37_05570 [candidate division KSB1 bacterium]|nr:hypothetical protein [candidate division KSB1 bacterium]
MKNPIKLFVSFLVSGFLALLLITCELSPPSAGSEEENPYDSTSADYVPPETYLLTASPAEGEIIHTSFVTFNWAGNEHVNQFSYWFDIGPWSVWISETSAAFYYLDERSYVFKVKGRYPSGAKDPTPAQVTFIVNAVAGPALMIKPRKKIASFGTDFMVEIVAEEVTDLLGAHVVLSFNKDQLQVQQVEAGEFWETNGAQVMLFKDVYNDLGLLDLNAAISLGDHVGVDGTGVIFRIMFRSYQVGSSDLLFTQDCRFRDHELREIPIYDMVNGLVEIK